MPFTDKDRDRLIKLSTDMDWVKTSYGDRLEKLEISDGMIHGRINKIKFWAAATFGGTSLGSVLIGWFNNKGQ